ncbi:MAG: NADH-quinone oxidoreductase subunit A [Candidatus Midichloria sp.]|nr:MAG: NADH-quinone oxidoreductase subunit A [Candidatus Midichloria sp.]
MNSLLYQYMPILIFLIIALALAFALLVVPFFASSIRDDREKLSQYECGFEAFNTNEQSRFDIRFYLVSILFIIFDLEIALLFPWALVMQQLGIVGFVSMITFLFILTVGFIYEWKNGALD